MFTPHRILRTAALGVLFAGTALAQPVHAPSPTQEYPGDAPPGGATRPRTIEVRPGQGDVSIRYPQGSTVVIPKSGHPRQPEVINPAAGTEKPFAESVKEIARTDDAEDYLDKPEIETQDNGIRYVSGGVGEYGKEQMKLLEPGFRLKLTFAANTGHYLSGVSVRIADKQGATVLSAVTEGPTLLVDLPAGDYKVDATYDESTASKNVNVKDKGLKSYTLTYSEPVI